MIFVTVGTQFPFDRLVRIIDKMVPELSCDVFAQIGEAEYLPANMKYSAWLTPAQFEDNIRRCDLVISHAGIGSIVSAQKYVKPIIIFPRRAAFGEHRNDHQLATCNQLGGRKGINVAYDDEALRSLVASGNLVAGDSADLVKQRMDFSQRIGQFIAAVL